MNNGKQPNIAPSVAELVIAEQRSLDRRLKSRYRLARWSLATRFVDNLISLTYRRQRADILFLSGLRYFDLIRGASRQRDILFLARGIEDRLACVKHGIPYLSGNHWNMMFSQANLIEEMARREQVVEQILLDVDKQLRRWQPKAIVAFGVGVMERMVGVVARRKGIPHISIPHGTYSSEVFRSRSRNTDYWLVWGEHFRDICIHEAGISAERVYVLGYPGRVFNAAKRLESERPLAVCFLGQQFEKVDRSLLEPKRRLVQQVANACENLNHHLYYRPHPQESRSTAAALDFRIMLTKEGESLESAIKKYDVFLGISSTALVETSMANKTSAFLCAPEFAVIYDGKREGLYRVEPTEEAIQNFLLGVSSGENAPLAIDPDYIFLPENITQSLLELIDRIVREHPAS